MYASFYYFENKLKKMRKNSYINKTGVDHKNKISNYIIENNSDLPSIFYIKYTHTLNY